MRRKKWIILGVCMLLCMINVFGCVKKESKKIATGYSVDKVTPDSDVDYDLTNMNKDMVYATVYQLMANLTNISERRFASMVYIMLDKMKKQEHTIITAL